MPPIWGHKNMRKNYRNWLLMGFLRNNVKPFKNNLIDIAKNVFMETNEHCFNNKTTGKTNLYQNFIKEALFPINKSV